MTVDHQIIIIGAGFSGIGMGIELKNNGIEDFKILEKADTLGGTWRENSYPGAECDIPSALYSYSFAPNPNWHHVWSKRDQIFQYQKDVAEEYKLMEHFQFGTRISKASYESGVWTVTTSKGTITANHLISAIGQLHERFTPDIKGKETFSGHQFHAAKWDHSVDLRDQRVAVIGSAASAVQLIPEVAKQAAHLKVFQRTPNWMMEKPNRAYSRLEKWAARRLPFLSKIYRWFLYVLGDGVLYPALNGNPLAKWFVKLRVNQNLRKHIKDPELRKQLTPSYKIGAKRILFSHTFYQALNRDNVSLETNAIQEINSNGILTTNSSQFDCDTIVYATGFITNPFFKSIEIEGPNGTLRDAWQNGAQAYLGTHVHGFPNFHMMYGPNTNLGHNSIIIMIEAQAKFIAKTIREVHRRSKNSIEVPQALEDRYNHEIQQRLKRMVFSEISDSWYMDRGKITNNWAGNTIEYRRRLANQPLEEYVFS